MTAGHKRAGRGSTAGQRAPQPAGQAAGTGTRNAAPTGVGNTANVLRAAPGTGSVATAVTTAATYPDIRPGQSIELLKALHILTRDGKLNQDSRRKLKQVYHLVQFIKPLLDDVAGAAQGAGRAVSLVDHGAGKSYLGFILYDLYFKNATVPGHIYGIETRAELVQRSRELAAQLGFGGMTFLDLSVAASIDAPEVPAEVDIVTALHACNTATDDAIRFALTHRARHIVLAPCCQAEVAAALRQNKAQALSRGSLAELWRHPLHTREFGSQLTNVLRCLQLEAHGYQVTVTELVGWEHSLKNELIIATRQGAPNRAAARRLGEILEELGLTILAGRFFVPAIAAAGTASGT